MLAHMQDDILVYCFFYVVVGQQDVQLLMLYKCLASSMLILYPAGIILALDIEHRVLDL